uniref:Beta-carotene oxygenase 2a n=1 Tax=Hucho hucho TaxID=62062 RepID=A0A4W5LB48_9TELE
ARYTKQHTGASHEKSPITYVHGLPCIEKIVASVDETPETISTNISGTIPEWIRGNFLRIGPGKFEIGNNKFNHWFDGMALLHQFKIAGGQGTYKSRFLGSDCYTANSENSRIVLSEFGTVAMPDPCKNFIQRFLSRFKLPSEFTVQVCSSRV